MPDFSVHDAGPGVHDGRFQRSRWSDFGVHDAPIRAFTMVRFPHSRHARAPQSDTHAEYRARHAGARPRRAESVSRVQQPRVRGRFSRSGPPVLRLRAAYPLRARGSPRMQRMRTTRRASITREEAGGFTVRVPVLQSLTQSSKSKTPSARESASDRASAVVLRDARRSAAVAHLPAAKPWRKNAMTKLRRTSDSISARPRIIGVWMRAAAPGLREMPSSAAAAALP